MLKTIYAFRLIIIRSIYLHIIIVKGKLRKQFEWQDKKQSLIITI